jgi:hypothetical protein
LAIFSFCFAILFIPCVRITGHLSFPSQLMPPIPVHPQSLSSTRPRRRSSDPPPPTAGWRQRLKDSPLARDQLAEAERIDEEARFRRMIAKQRERELAEAELNIRTRLALSDPPQAPAAPRTASRTRPGSQSDRDPLVARAERDARARRRKLAASTSQTPLRPRAGPAQSRPSQEKVEDESTILARQRQQLQMLKNRPAKS